MTRSTVFTHVGAVVTFITIAVLALAFTLPRCYLGSMLDTLNTEAAMAEQAVLSGDIEKASESIDNMINEYSSRLDNLKLFFHHDDLDDMQKALHCCRDLALLGQSDNLVCELNEVMQIMEHMHSVESLTIYEIF